MPLYEYRCNNCRRRVTILVRGSFRSSIACPHCGNTELERLFSKFSVRKPEEAVYEDILSDSQLVKGLEQSDPRALALWNKRMSQGTDEEIAPEYNEMLERMESGEMSDSPITGGEIQEE